MTMTRTQVKSGLEAFLDGAGLELDGMRIGLVTNPNGVDAHYRSTIDHLFESRRVKLVSLFGPEHGVRGDAQAGDHVAQSVDARTGLPVYSIYGETRRPTPQMLHGIDAIAIDLQDLGIRYATYLSTLVEVQAAAHDAGIEVIIFDRPNPLADIALEGNTLDPAFGSFVGAWAIPVRHGMTLGELGAMIASERGWRPPIVLPAAGLHRLDWYDETGLPWIPPSPNIPTLDALTLYGGTCLAEGTSWSEGRGSTRPFEYIGTPGIDAQALADDLNGRQIAGAAFRPVHFAPWFSKHKGTVCSGVQVIATDRNALNTVSMGLHLLHAMRRADPGFSWVRPNDDDRPFFIDLLCGSDLPRKALDSGATPDEIASTWIESQEAFRARREPFLLYDEGERA